MKIEEKNCVVGIEYELTEAGGSEIIDSNKGGAPLEFITGKGHIIPGLESQLIGMGKGESSSVTVKASDAYGDLNPEAIQLLPKEQFEGIDLNEGMVLHGQGEDGQMVQVTVKSFDDNGVTVDFNHPLAGKDLLFNVTIADVREATVDEALSGQVACCDDHSEGSCCGGGHCH
ncbi:MAG: peptidylprolyl isomerase [Campylobacterales bacterium]|nr:peptidylprolyl isomerase [Campylobacterales bacterium]